MSSLHDEWRRCSWGDLAELRYGKALRDYRSGAGEYEVFGTNGPIGWHSQALFPAGVIVGRKGAYRGIHFARQPCWVIDTAFYLDITSPEVDPRWAYYQLKTVDLNAIDSGSAIPSTSREAFAVIPVLLPPLPVQRQVSQILSTLDELEENNRRRIELLEQTAQAIYREWFVRFRYPGHEDGAFVDSPLGPIPEGWEVRRVDEVAALVRGRSYRKHELVESGGHPFVNLKCMMRGGGFRRDGLKRYDGKFTSDQQVGRGDIVLAVTDLTQGREILARATLVPRLAEGLGIISLDVARLVPIDAADRLALFFALRCTDYSDRVKEFANGSTVLHLNPAHVAEGLLVWPTDCLRRQFGEVAEPLVDQVDDLNDAADRLGSIRDALLPRLVTGRIDVSALDLGALVGSVA